MRDGLETHIDSAVSKAVAEATKSAQTEADRELALFKQQASANDQLLKQQIAYLKEQSAGQQTEIKRLQQEVAQASQYVTRIAERAVEKPSANNTATSQPASKV